MKHQNWQTEIDQLKLRGVEFETGLTESEMRLAEESVGANFPADLRSFLQTALPQGHGWPNWREPNSWKVRDALDWPVNGLAFDIRNNVFWWPAWGVQPELLVDAVRIMMQSIREAPRLIPVYMHAYMPAEPNECGNPPISIHQADAIYAGHDLSEYLLRILPPEGFEYRLPRCDGVRRIRFWSDLVEWNGGCMR